jgi:hypothetical protein
MSASFIGTLCGSKKGKKGQKGQKLFLAFFALFAFFASCPPSALRVDFLRISFTS